jgi:aminoglycoside phosphotransferase (APT) family kinase protein
MSISGQRIGEYLRRLDPRILGLREMKAITVRKIGLGEANISYLAVIDGKKFVIRINMEPASAVKFKREYESLRIVEPLRIAPRAFHFEPSKKVLGRSFIILEYLEGRSLDQCKEINDSTVRELGRVVAKLHNADVKDIKGFLNTTESSKSDLLHGIQRTIYYVKARRSIYFEKKGNLERIIAASLRRLRGIKFDETCRLVLGHGDIAPQNVILSGGNLKLIDWEDLGLIDPALETAIIFDQFDFSDEQKQQFLYAYLQLRHDSELTRRISVFWPFQLFRSFCWAIMHVYEIGEREMHEEFLAEQRLSIHIDYAEKMFKKCQEQGIIDRNTKWNAHEIFPKKYLASS